MTRPAFRPLWPTLLLLAGLQACSTQTEKSNNVFFDSAESRNEAFQAAARQIRPTTPLMTEDTSVRFTSSSIGLEKKGILPPHIQNITVRYPGRHNLATIADILSRTLDVVVLMTPDALLPPQAAPNAAPAGAANAAAPAGAANAAPDNMLRLSRLAQDAGAARLNLTPEQVNTYELNYSGTLAGLLDRIASQAELSWTFEDGRIVFRRTVTEYFFVKVLPGAVKSSSSFSTSMGGSASKVDSEIGGDLWEALKTTLPLLLSPSGKFQLDTKLGMVTVRDSVRNVKEVARYVEQINQLFMRQVNIQVEIVQIDLNNESQNGIDWGRISRSLANSTTLLSTGPAFNSGSTTPGSIGLFRGGSEFLFKALERYGRVSNMYSAVVNTMHRQPVPLSVTNTRTYLRGINPGTPASGTTPATSPTLSVADLNTGFNFSFVPAILDSNRVLLESAISISAQRELLQFATGTGDNVSVIQQPNVDNFQNIQRVSMALGETLVLLGYEYEEARNTVTDVVRNQLRGSRLALRNKKTVIILLTPSLSGF
jgi:type IVB pilus formation R64 PilN family outer membrane protein